MMMAVDFEASIPYHRLVTELWATPFLVCRHATTSLSSTYWSKLECMVDFLRGTTQSLMITRPSNRGQRQRPNSTSPGSRFDAVGVINDHRHLSSCRAAFGQRSNGPRGKSILFPCAQIAILRSKDCTRVDDVGPNGQGGNGGTLSQRYPLFLNCRPMATISSSTLVPAAILQTLDMRNDFRSTIMHNTVAVDGEEQNRIPNKEEGVFWMHSDSHPRVVQWETSVKRICWKQSTMASADSRSQLPISVHLTLIKDQKNYPSVITLRESVPINLNGIFTFIKCCSAHDRKKMNLNFQLIAVRSISCAILGCLLRCIRAVIPHHMG